MSDSATIATSFESFERNDQFFIKSFLLDDSTNINGWGVTREALEQNLQSFVGQPFVVTPEFGHPDEAVQENYRKGDIIEAGIDQTSGKAFAVSKITDAKTIEQIRKGEIQFVSPSVGADEEDVERNTFNGKAKITVKRFKGYHLAGVKEPAFGVYKAQIKGQCTGTTGTCTKHLQQVQASVSSLVPNEPPYKQMSAIAQAVLPDYSAQIEGLKKDFMATIEQKDARINELSAKLEQEIKRPSIERILSAKVELGKIKAEETTVESTKLSKIDASELSFIASELEGAVKAKKDMVSQKPSGYRIQANASATDAPKNGDEWLARLKRGVA